MSNRYKDPFADVGVGEEASCGFRGTDGQVTLEPGSELVYAYAVPKSFLFRLPRNSSKAPSFLADFVHYGLRVESYSPAHVCFSCTAQQFYSIFSANVGQDVTGCACLVGRPVLPSRLASGFVGVLVPHAPRLYDWPDPPEGVVDGCFYSQGTAVWAMKENFDSYWFTGKPRLMFLSDVREQMGISAVLSGDALVDLQSDGAGSSGTGVGIHVVDSGIDLSTGILLPGHPDSPHPFFASSGQLKLEFPEVFDFGESYEPWLDEVGHGTMVTAAALNAAPSATVKMYKLPENKWSGVGGLVRMAEAVANAAVDIPSVVSVSLGWPRLLDEYVPPLVDGSCFSDTTGEVSELLEYSLDLILEMAETYHVPFCAATGNVFPISYLKVDYSSGGLELCALKFCSDFISFPGCMERAVRVGGAFPTSLAAPTSPLSWEASNYAMSGINPDSPYATPFPDVCGVVNMFNGYTDSPEGICVPCGRQACALEVQGTNEWVKGYRIGGGTSFATPTVAGIIALLLSRFPEFQTSPAAVAANTAGGLKNWLAAACVDVRKGGSGGEDIAFQGADVATGPGVLNALHLLDNAAWHFEGFKRKAGHALRGGS